MQYLNKFRKNKYFKLLTALFCILLFISTIHAKNYSFVSQIQWNKNINFTFGNQSYPSFYNSHKTGLNENAHPLLIEKYQIDGRIVTNLSILVLEYDLISEEQFQNTHLLGSEIKYNYNIGFLKGVPQLMLNITPCYKSGNQVVLVKKYKVAFNTTETTTIIALNKKASKSNSVLATGKWYKLATQVNGIHRIDYGLIKSMGINVDNIDPRNIQIWGRGAGMQPQFNNAKRIDDLVEIPILVNGEADGKFNNNDLILFYGQSQIDNWIYNATSKTYTHNPNIFADTTYYYLTVGTQPGIRVSTASVEPNFTQTTNEKDFLYVYENEKTNLIKSGKVWVGEEFDRVLTQQFSVSIPDFISTKPVKMVSSVTARSFVASTFNVKVNGVSALTHNCNLVYPGYDQDYTSGLNFQSAQLNLNNGNFVVEYYYNKPASGSIGWLDFFEIWAKAELKNNNSNFIFKNATTVGSNQITQFNINTPRDLTVWDITNPIFPFKVSGNFNSNNFAFNAKTDSLRTFVAYDGSNYLQPKFIAEIANQNLHGLPFADMLIITPGVFLTEANRLAEHHQAKQNMRVHVVNIQDIYNEFSGGVQDLVAIRDFIKMFYDRATSEQDKPKYVLLFGRASYDYKNRLNNNTNFVPVFQSFESFRPVSSYCSDDFIGYLDDNEGRWDTGSDVAELLDIGIGRLPVFNNEQATAVVNKIINYARQEAFGDWRNRITFVGDDEDGNAHQSQSNNLANRIINNHKWLNVEKVFVDAYKEVTVAGGKRNYDAQNAIVRAVDRGCLIMNYTGHGGEIGWSKKRILELNDINGWKNFNKLPLFVTATCEFSRFDDPSRSSAGEDVILNPNGGGIALFTTVRLVFSGNNEILNNRFYDKIGFDSVSQLSPLMLGNILMETKNSYPDKNTRNFVLLGDPALTVAYPKYQVKTTAINNTPIANFKDTLKALSLVTINGVVADRQGNILNNFNGEVYPTVYDKFKSYQTIGNNVTSPPMNFSMQNNLIYRGTATVSNGLFTFKFLVPKDINYNIGNGKISYYVSNQLHDGTGFDNSIIIGGTADSVAEDKVGPQIKLYLNDEKFVNGGLTNQNPTLIAKIFDENGINTTGQGIGRDLTAVLNNDNSKSIVLNEYFTTDINSYQSGNVSYNLKDLPAGSHTIKLKVFDTYNNASEQSLDFVVANNDKLALNHVLNYPNPFTTFTTFHFDHNRQGEQLETQIQIFTVNGKLVKTINNSFLATSNHFDNANWDATDDFGNRLANGVYIYKVTVKPTNGKAQQQIQKLVIFK